jgi:hypothetical protein
MQKQVFKRLVQGRGEPEEVVAEKEVKLEICVHFLKSKVHFIISGLSKSCIPLMCRNLTKSCCNISVLPECKVDGLQ